jgi:hypothetical protein
VVFFCLLASIDAEEQIHRSENSNLRLILILIITWKSERKRSLIRKKITAWKQIVDQKAERKSLLGNKLIESKHRQTVHQSNNQPRRQPTEETFGFTKHREKATTSHDEAIKTLKQVANSRISQEA